MTKDRNNNSFGSLKEAVFGQKDVAVKTKAKSSQEIAITQTLESMDVLIRANYAGDTKSDGFKKDMKELNKLTQKFRSAQKISDPDEKLKQINYVDDKLRALQGDQITLQKKNTYNP